MADLCEGGNEPSGSLKAICLHSNSERRAFRRKFPGSSLPTRKEILMLVGKIDFVTDQKRKRGRHVFTKENLDEKGFLECCRRNSPFHTSLFYVYKRQYSESLHFGVANQNYSRSSIARYVSRRHDSENRVSEYTVCTFGKIASEKQNRKICFRKVETFRINAIRNIRFGKKDRKGRK
ncbi:hypothetical protein ANN_01344 [Periplaneta americana]|uniref:Uncharacterized protein n=1 Tax=Periplaneta americana TaxID=6978 RepID=A0ABQ8TTA4_PERAM|nr:hypothetical protein ANN_01344 [Periplaneta americana]